MDAVYFKMPDPVGLQEDSKLLEIPRTLYNKKICHVLYTENNNLHISV